MSDASTTDHNLDARVTSLEDSRRTTRWILGLALPALFTALVGVAFYFTDAVKASAERSGEVKATVQGIERTLTALDADVRELRLKILKLTATDPSKVGVVAVGAP
jgi:hypothetical protein